MDTEDLVGWTRVRIRADGAAWGGAMSRQKKARARRKGGQRSDAERGRTAASAISLPSASRRRLLFGSRHKVAERDARVELLTRSAGRA